MRKFEIDSDSDWDFDRAWLGPRRAGLKRSRKKEHKERFMACGICSELDDDDYDSDGPGEPNVGDDWNLNSSNGHRDFYSPCMLLSNALDTDMVDALIAAVEEAPGSDASKMSLSDERDSGGAWRRKMCAIDPRKGPVDTNCSGVHCGISMEEFVTEPLWPSVYSCIRKLVRRTCAEFTATAITIEAARSAVSTVATVDHLLFISSDQVVAAEIHSETTIKGTNGKTTKSKKTCCQSAPCYLWPELSTIYNVGREANPGKQLFVTSAQYCQYSRGGHFGRWHVDEVTGDGDGEDANDDMNTHHAVITGTGATGVCVDGTSATASPTKPTQTNDSATRACSHPSTPSEMYKLVSFAIMLSSPSDYEGGEFELLDFGWGEGGGRKNSGSQQLQQPQQQSGPSPAGIISLRPPANTAIVFTARHTVHRVRPVTAGVRRSLVFWLCDRDVTASFEDCHPV